MSAFGGTNDFQKWAGSTSDFGLGSDRCYARKSPKSGAYDDVEYGRSSSDGQHSVAPRPFEDFDVACVKHQAVLTKCLVHKWIAAICMKTRELEAVLS